MFFQESLQQQQLMGVTSQTGTGTGTPASLATPPTTVHPVRQTSIAAQHLKSQRSINNPATATPPKVRPQSRNLLLNSSDPSFSGSQPKPRQNKQTTPQQLPPSQQQPSQTQQDAQTDISAPGLPFQTSSAKENQVPAAAVEESTDTPTKSSKKSQQAQLQPPQQHLLKPVANKQVNPTNLLLKVKTVEENRSNWWILKNECFKILNNHLVRSINAQSLCKSWLSTSNINF